jgi:acyl transferase domain-containing protein
LTGTWITDAEATDPAYWARHLRHAVRFADGMTTLLAEPGRIYLEVGPGNTLTTLATRNAEGTTFETSLWIIEDEGSLWLRAGNPDSSWLKRIRATPQVEVTRGDETVVYLAEVVSGRSGRVNQRMAEEYGWADQVIALMRDSESTRAIRLVPVGG